MSLKRKYVFHLEENVCFIARAAPEDRANHNVPANLEMVRAKELPYFQLETGVIEAKIIFQNISSRHGQHAFKLRLFSNI